MLSEPLEKKPPAPKSNLAKVHVSWQATDVLVRRGGVADYIHTHASFSRSQASSTTHVISQRDIAYLARHHSSGINPRITTLANYEEVIIRDRFPTSEKSKLERHRERKMSSDGIR